MLQSDEPSLLPSCARAEPNIPVVDLGTAGNYAILAKAGISTVPDSVITGNIAVSQGESIHAREMGSCLRYEGPPKSWQGRVEWGRRASHNAGVEFTNELQQHWETAHRSYFGSNVMKKAWIKHLAEFAEREDDAEISSNRNARMKKCVDLNGDGVVNWKEFYHWIAPLGVSEDEGKKAFDICDLDGSVTLDLDEFAACARYYYDMKMSESANFYVPYEEENEI